MRTVSARVLLGIVATASLAVAANAERAPALAGSPAGAPGLDGAPAPAPSLTGAPARASSLTWVLAHAGESAPIGSEGATAMPPRRAAGGRRLGADRGGEQRWLPARGSRWQYQLESGRSSLRSPGGIEVGICRAPFSGGPCVRPDVFDIDLYLDERLAGDNRTPNRPAVRAIHARGAHAVCYVSAGTGERFRPDYGRYLRFHRRHGRKLLGKPFSERFSNERWLNLNNGRGQRDFILRRVRARTAKCARAGFDGIEYDVVDAYAQGRRVTGWRISARTQLRFNRALARIAHRHGLAAGLKNDLGQLSRLEPHFDFAINEQCIQYRECVDNPAPGYHAFTRAGKPVVVVEYRTRPRRFCPVAERLGLSAIGKARDFSLRAAPWRPCS